MRTGASLLKRVAAMFVLSVSATVCQGIEKEASPPNIVLIMSDDMGYSDIGCDQYNRAQFKPVTTDGMRIEIQLQEKWAGGVHEWRVQCFRPSVRRHL